MFPLIPKGGARIVITQLVRARVYQTFRQNNRIVYIRQYNFTAARRIVWRNHLIQVRTYSTTRVTSWFPDWLTQWRQQQPVQQIPQQPSDGGGDQRDPRRLTVDQLVAMMADSSSYMVHGTPDAGVGTLQEPLVGFEDPQARISNPVAPIGVYAFRGISGAYDMGYGPYFVIMRAGMGVWVQQGAHWYRPGTAAIPDSWVVGYCLREDIAAAKARRS